MYVKGKQNNLQKIKNIKFELHQKFKTSKYSLKYFTQYYSLTERRNYIYSKFWKYKNQARIKKQNNSNM